MSSITDMANITTDKASSSEASSKLTKQQMNQNIVLSMLHIFLSLLKYTNLWDFCHTCQLLFKFKKYTNYKLNYDYSLLYYRNKIFRTKVLSRIANPLKQLYLKINLSDITNLTIVGRISRSEYNKFKNAGRNIVGCDIITKCRRMVDLSALKNVYYLKIVCCSMILDRITDLSILKDITMLDLSGCWDIKNANSLKNVCILSLCRCDYIKNANGLKNVRILDLSMCKELNDISELGNVDTLNLSYCRKITDVSPLSRVRVLNLSYCKNITNVCALENVVLNLTGCRVDVFTRRELQKKVPTLLVSENVDCPMYKKFINKYFNTFQIS
jgi:hypothetical protein